MVFMGLTRRDVLLCLCLAVLLTASSQDQPSSPVPLSLCASGPSRVWVEPWAFDDDKTKSTPHALIFENVIVRGNTVHVCDMTRTKAREILCTYNRGCARSPELAFPGLRIANEKEGWIEGDDSFVSGEEKGCLAHYAAKQQQQQQGEGAAPSQSLLGMKGYVTLNGTTLRHVMRSSNIGHYFNGDFFHFYRMLTPAFVVRDGVAKNASERSSVAPSGSNSNSSSPASALGSFLGMGGSSITSLKESALSAFRSKKSSSSSSSSSSSISSSTSSSKAGTLPSYILMDSIIDYRNWSFGGVKYEPFFSEGRGAADGLPNSRDLDGVGLGKGLRSSATIDTQASLLRDVRQNKEWVRSLVYCSVVRPYQLALSSNISSSSGGGDVASNASAPSLAASTTTSTGTPAQQRWVHMQDSKVAYHTSRLVLQPLDRCVAHGLTNNFEERKRRLANLRIDVHDCVSVNRTEMGASILLYGRLDTSKRRWTNVYELAARIQAAPGIRLPVRVVERMPHTFREQVQLFSSAAMLITVHGSALMNVFAMPYSSTLVEMVRLSKGETSLIKSFGLDAAVAQHVVIDIRDAPVSAPAASASAPASASVASPATPTAATSTSASITAATASASASSSSTQNAGDFALSFNLLRQKLCDINTLKKPSNTNTNNNNYKKEDPSWVFADMNIFCRNVTSSTQAASYKSLAAGIVAAVGGF